MSITLPRPSQRGSKQFIDDRPFIPRGWSVVLIPTHLNLVVFMLIRLDPVIPVAKVFCFNTISLLRRVGWSVKMAHHFIFSFMEISNLNSV